MKRPGQTVGSANWVLQNLGLVSMTLVALALSGYLIYAMLYPERF